MRFKEDKSMHYLLDGQNAERVYIHLSLFISEKKEFFIYYLNIHHNTIINSNITTYLLTWQKIESYAIFNSLVNKK